VGGASAFVADLLRVSHLFFPDSSGYVDFLPAENSLNSSYRRDLHCLLFPCLMTAGFFHIEWAFCRYNPRHLVSALPFAACLFPTERGSSGFFRILPKTLFFNAPSE